MTTSAGAGVGASTKVASAAPVILTGITTPTKPVRVVDPFRLRRRAKWSDIAPYINGIKVSMDAAEDGTAGCKELWRQSRSKSVCCYSSAAQTPVCW